MRQDKITDVVRMLDIARVDPGIVSPNYVAEFAYNRGVELTSEEVVFISDNY